MMLRRVPRPFLTWLNQSEPDTPDVVFEERNLYGVVPDDRHCKIIAMLRDARAAIKKGQKIRLNVDTNLGSATGAEEIACCLKFPAKISHSTNIASFDFVAHNSNVTDISNLNIRTFRFLRGITSISLNHCWIDNLYLDRDAIVSLTMRDCWVGKLHLDSRCISDLTVASGGVLSVSAPPPYSDNPFRGTVILGDDVYFPRHDGAYKGAKFGSQPWTNVRSHLLKMHNVSAAGRFHSVELAIERRNLAFVPRSFSWVYEMVSDYGNSVGLPIFWMIVFWAISFLVFWLADGAAINSGAAIENWRTAFAGNGSGKAALRSLWLSAQAVINPLGVIRPDPAVEPSGPVFLLAHNVHRLLNIVLIFLTIFALRRRFKLSA